jgi:hypothetical protein
MITQPSLSPSPTSVGSASDLSPLAPLTPSSSQPSSSLARHYVRVLMSEDNGGGYVSLRCDTNTTALTLRTKALDKV